MSVSVEPQPFDLRKHGGVILVAILAGMATAAGFVLVHALRSPALTTTAATKPNGAPEGRYSKPSAFGDTITPTSTSSDVKLSAAQIAQTAAAAVVTVTAYDDAEEPISQGVGYVYASSGLIITSYSAIRGAVTVTVDTAKGDELNVIALMGYSPSRDLAVLAVLEGNLPALETGPAEIVQEGDSVVAVAPGNAVFRGTVGPRRAMGGVDLFQTTAPAPGGSPVISEHGKVIGISTRNYGGMVVPSRYISDMLAEQRVLSFADMLRETGTATVIHSEDSRRKYASQSNAHP